MINGLHIIVCDPTLFISTVRAEFSIKIPCLAQRSKLPDVGKSKRSYSELISENIFNDIYALYYTALWEDVTNFYFGLKNSITEKQIELLISKNPYKESDNLMYNLELYSMGRLLQYAWNTEKQVKKYGIHLAIKNILELRECIHDFNKKDTQDDQS